MKISYFRIESFIPRTTKTLRGIYLQLYNEDLDMLCQYVQFQNYVTVIFADLKSHDRLTLHWSTAIELT